MGSFSLLALLCTFVLLLDAAPDKNRNELLSQKFEPSVGRSAAPLRRDRRFVVSAIWTAMGLIKDFSDRVSFVKGTIAKVKSWFGVGDAPGTPPPNTQDVINEINGIKDQVEDLRDDVLAGQEWGFVLTVLGDPIKNLKALVFQEDDYLGKMKQSSLADSVKKQAQNRFYITQVNDPACSDRRNLASLQNGILSGTGLHKPLYEAYADKIGQQNTGTALDVVKFIARTQQMQAHVYALLEEGVDFKPISSTVKQHEISLYQYDVQRVTPRQGPRIAEALNVIMDHKGSAVFGRIKAKHNPHSGKCLTRKLFEPFPEAYVEMQTCSNTDNGQLWKLSDGGYIIPKSHTNEAMYLHERGSSRNWRCWTGNTMYPQPRVQTKSSSSTTFKFQFSTSDFTLFQIKKRSANQCLTTRRNSGTLTLTCTKPCAAIGSSGSGDTWFVWEPREEE